MARLTALRDTLQELRELGPGGALFRLGWELRRRSGYFTLRDAWPAAPSAAWAEREGVPWGGLTRLGLGDPAAAAAVAAQHGSEAARAALLQQAADATRGRILCFGRWIGDYGDPIDWHRDPTTGGRWSPERHWSRSLARQPGTGDIKLTWEVGRFPQAYSMARAALLDPPAAGPRQELVAALAAQIGGFIAANPPPSGVHWVSGQELVFRLMAWSFALHALPELRQRLDAERVARAVAEHVSHVARYLEYAQHAVTNNHLLSEACGLLLGAAWLEHHPDAAGWWERGWRLLEQQAEEQFYGDGGYIQQSHNYHRVALQVLLWASALAEGVGRRPAAGWLRALGRSVDFLAAQQNACDGRLPNFGANDGALPSVLSGCDYADFRPTLQAAQVRARGERLYPPGPWDEEAAWFVGADALAAAPLRPLRPHSRSFALTGMHVLRAANPGEFGVLRCGTLRHRFAQIDMLQLDLWWRGQNVLVDGGSYLYNGPVQWHRHFMGTASHNTVVVDGRDQMVHHRQFKLLYPAPARLLRWQDRAAYALAAGEHLGYARWPGKCVHRRSVLWLKEQVWVVVDTLRGSGEHALRLHWLGGPYPCRAAERAGEVVFETPAGECFLRVLDGSAAARPVAVIEGQSDPPCGWLARYYGEKVPAPAIVAQSRAALPQVFVTLIGARAGAVQVDGPARWTIELPDAGELAFTLVDGLIEGVQVPAQG